MRLRHLANELWLLADATSKVHHASNRQLSDLRKAKAPLRRLLDVLAIHGYWPGESKEGQSINYTIAKVMMSATGAKDIDKFSDGVAWAEILVVDTWAFLQQASRKKPRK